MKLHLAQTEPYIESIRTLFREYEAELAVDLCFQHFEQELASLPGKYAPPKGVLWLASQNDTPCGCIGLRPLADGICEMKRLYIQPAYRSRGWGRTLTETAIQSAKDMSYHTIYLDTLETLDRAIQLYESLGFCRTSPYYNNPLPGVVYMALDLRR